MVSRWCDLSVVYYVGTPKELEALAAMEREGEFAGQLRGKLGPFA